MQIMEKSKPKNAKKLMFTSYISNKTRATQKEITLGNKATPIPRIVADLSLLFFIDEAIDMLIFKFLMDSQDEGQNDLTLAIHVATSGLVRILSG